MNFLDTYEITGTGTSTPPQPNPSEQSLNEEVTQVIGQLGRFWGGFRKQVSHGTVSVANVGLTLVLIRAKLLWSPPEKIWEML